MMAQGGKESVLIIGGTRFSGAYLWKELNDRGHDVTLYNRGKTPPQRLPGESEQAFETRKQQTKYLKGDRTNADALRDLIDPSLYTYVYDMNGREATDTAPLADLFASPKSQLKSFIYMSSAGVYKKSDEMPHVESDPTDPKSRHKGKLETEAYLRGLGPNFKWCSFRPTYICGPGNYNPVEQFFFERVDQGRPICVPGHGAHLTGLGHVKDLATAMANVIGREARTAGQVYNVQNTNAITFDGVARAAAAALGRDPKEQQIVHYDPSAFKFPEGKKTFPMRPQHFFTGVSKAMRDLDWAPEFNSAEALLKDSYVCDYVLKKAAGKIKFDFECDDMILNAGRVPAGAGAK